MKRLVLVIVILIFACKEKNSNFKKNNHVKQTYIKSDLNQLFEKFIEKNKLEFEKEQVYLINFCLTKSNDTMVYFHKTFYTKLFFIGSDIMEYKGWFLSENNEPVIIYDYKRPLGRKLYNEDSLLKTEMNKRFTERHTNLAKHINIKEYLLNNNNIIETGIEGPVILGEKIINLTGRVERTEIKEASSNGSD